MKFLFDLLPIILFFIAFKAYDIFVATAVAIVVTFVQIGWVWLRHRKVDNMMWISLFVIILFGGATLLFRDENFIKWKPTVLYWLFAVVLFISNSFFQKDLIRIMLEKQIKLPQFVWNKLNLSWIVFFVLMGCVNLYVAYGFSVDTWVTFKLFGSTALMLIFVVLQVLMLNKHIILATSEYVDSEEREVISEKIENKTNK